MKGIILAGGTGTRMFPTTLAVTKQLFPIYDKPMVYYPLSLLMLAGITEILVICRKEEQPLFEKVLHDGSQWGLEVEYANQEEPKGIAEAFIIGEEFIDNQPVCLVLGDNIVYGNSLAAILQEARASKAEATFFSYQVKEPQHYGVLVFDESGKPIAIEEKPKEPKSNHAVIGLYMYQHSVAEIAKTIKPSARGELEITTLNQHYLDHHECSVQNLGRGMAWLDTGTHKSMLEASNFIHIIEARQGVKICCPGEIAWRNKYINDQQLRELAGRYQSSSYGKYLLGLLED